MLYRGNEQQFSTKGGFERHTQEVGVKYGQENDLERR